MGGWGGGRSTSSLGAHTGLLEDPFPYSKPGQMLAIFKEQAFLLPSFLNQVIWFLSTEVPGEPGDWGGVLGRERSFCAVHGGSVRASASTGPWLVEGRSQREQVAPAPGSGIEM